MVLSSSLSSGVAKKWGKSYEELESPIDYTAGLALELNSPDGYFLEASCSGAVTNESGRPCSQRAHAHMLRTLESYRSLEFSFSFLTKSPTAGKLQTWTSSYNKEQWFLFH